MAKYVVIGSNAFSGQDFVDLLLDDPSREVIGISRSPEKPSYMLRYRQRPDLSRFRFAQFDMNRDIDAMLAFLDSERPDYIVNFAAQSEVAPSWEHPDHWFQTNTVALARFVNHMRKQNYLKKYLHVSSPEAYGNCVGTVTEDTPDNPSTPYAASKSAADMLLKVYQKQYGFPALFVRATNVYGARQQLFKIIPRTVIYIKMGNRIQLHGGGVAVKSYIEVRDVSRGELAMLEAGVVGERYHLSPDGGIAVRDAVAMVAARLGKTLEEVADIAPERPGQDAAYVIDSGKARREFGWAPQIGFEQGVAETVDWVEANWDAIRCSPLDYQHMA
ncbi:GDP-mannose 4,6-dehydratase [Azospirillum halopraeferens]|uniref:GDP-mannose 4,6-dehydratase n=1 Tax=Azospirillum halopraeferens TaxID=34010 RepID=UPI0003FBF8A6|nr:GDP-mannose 4,6-dehydratase [Azospirillum halopraeferens]